MKFTDDETAKLRIWAREGKVLPLPRVRGVPQFASRKFSSYAELNRWKKDLLKRIARAGGVTWTR